MGSLVAALSLICSWDRSNFTQLANDCDTTLGIYTRQGGEFEYADLDGNAVLH